MIFPSIDIPTFIWAPFVALFWLAVLVQWFTRQREAARIREAEKCAHCGKDDLEVDLHLVNQRTNRKVSLLKNIWAGVLLSIFGIIFLRLVAIMFIDIFTGSNTSGIHDINSWKLQVGFVSWLLIPGILCAFYGPRFLLDYIVGEKVKVINLTCNSCKKVTVLE